MVGIKFFHSNAAFVASNDAENVDLTICTFFGMKFHDKAAQVFAAEAGRLKGSFYKKPLNSAVAN